MLRLGLSISEINDIINNPDIRVKEMWLTEAQKQNRLRRLQQKLDIAEAINFAYVGSKYDKRKANQRSYSNWQKKLEREIAKLQGQQIATVFDSIKRSRKLK